MLLLVNLTASMVLIILLTAITYLMRIISYYDNSNIRELDCLYFSIILVAFHLLFGIFDIVWRKSVIGVIFLHHFTLGVYLLSNTLDLHHQQKMIETVSLLGFLLLSTPFMVINIAYFFVMKNDFFSIEQPMLYSNLMMNDMDNTNYDKAE